MASYLNGNYIYNLNDLVFLLMNLYLQKNINIKRRSDTKTCD